jgi:hypothetical protein
LLNCFRFPSLTSLSCLFTLFFILLNISFVLYVLSLCLLSPLLTFIFRCREIIVLYQAQWKWVESWWL